MINGCFHNPSKYSNWLFRFFHILFRRKHVYFHHDDTGQCSTCQADIITPWEYYGFWVMLSYFIAGVAAGMLVAVLKNQTIGESTILVVSIVAVAMLVYDRIASAFVLAVFSWEPYEKEDFDLEDRWNSAKKMRHKKFNIAACGIAVAGAIYIIYLLCL